MIENFGNESNLEEFSDVWADYRAAMREGVTRLPDVTLRNLFGAMSMLQAHAEMRLAILESVRDKKKLDVELDESRLLVTKYNSGPMNGRMASVHADEEYQNAVKIYNNRESDVVIAKGIAKATATAAAALSREISARMKS